jgi:hypothetical protein
MIFGHATACATSQLQVHPAKAGKHALPLLLMQVLVRLTSCTLMA